MSADETGQEDAGTGDGTPSTEELSAKVDGLDAKLDALIERFGSAERGARDAAGQRTEDRLNRPTTVAEEIRQQLAEAKAQAAKEDAEKGTADRLAATEAKLAELSEKPPEAPVGRVARALFGRS
jgi:hypothetical protein